MPKKLIHRTMIVVCLLLVAKGSLYAAVHEAKPYPLTNNYDENAKKRFSSLKKLIHDIDGLSEKVCLVRVNDFFNQVPYASDQKNWGNSDYWATPAEMLERGKADCEDYAIAKFFTLLELGIPEKKLFLTYVLTDNLTTKHMVLVYYENDNAVPLILDNRMLSILPETLNKNYMPLYRFNLNRSITYDQGFEHKISIDMDKVPKWEKLTKRMFQARS